MLLITNSKVYDTLKWIAQVVLPAFGTLYFALAQLYGWDNGSKVVGTVVAVDAFLGVILHLSSVAYDKSEAKYDGVANVTETADKKTFDLALNSDPYDLDKKDSITLKVNKVKPLAKKVAQKRAPRKTSS